MFQYVTVSMTQNLVFFFFFLVEFLKDYFLSVSLSPSLCLFFPSPPFSHKNQLLYLIPEILSSGFVCFRPHWLFVAVLGLCWGWQALQHVGLVVGAQASLIVVHGFSCLEACGPRDWTCVPCIGSQTLNHWTTRKVAHSFCLTHPNLEVYNAVYLFIWLHRVLTAAHGTLVVHYVESFIAAWLRLSNCLLQTPEWEGFSSCSTQAQLLMLLLLLLLSRFSCVQLCATP